MKHSQVMVAGNSRPNTTSNVEELYSAPEMELVLIANNHALHACDAELAPQANKYVFIEKPIALSLNLQDMNRIIVPNPVFVGQCGTYPRTFHDYRESDCEVKTVADMEQALQVELGITITKETAMMWEVLSIRGSHYLSAVRESIGIPQGVVGFSPCATVGSFSQANDDSAIFQYGTFALACESGVDQVARFDASIEIFGDTKSVMVCIDKGLPTTMVVKETLPDGPYRESPARRTYEDPFMLELKDVYQWVSQRTLPKTTACDARQDLEILGMLMKATTS